MLGIGAYIYYDTHIVETPITKRKRFVAFSDEQIDEISKHELDMVFCSYLFSNDLPTEVLVLGHCDQIQIDQIKLVILTK